VNAIGRTTSRKPGRCRASGGLLNDWGGIVKAELLRGGGANLSAGRGSHDPSGCIYAKSGNVPGMLPIEMYCHTLTDPSILSAELQEQGYQTLTLFGLHTPAALFDADNEGAKAAALKAALASINQYLVEPIENVIAAIEVKSPLDIEGEVGLPRGNIFHKDLSFPFREDNQHIRWGVETDDPRIFICGAGAIRGGGVSGIPGHNAAMAVLEASA